MSDRGAVYGLLAEFRAPEELLAAARAARAAGYRRIDAYTPVPVEGLSEALGHHHTRLPLIVLIGGILGGVGGFFLQYWAAVIDYPMNIGGRPLNSWPAFIADLRDDHPLRRALGGARHARAQRPAAAVPPGVQRPRFALASRDRFFLLIEANDPKFDRAATGASSGP